MNEKFASLQTEFAEMLTYLESKKADNKFLTFKINAKLWGETQPIEINRTFKLEL